MTTLNYAHLCEMAFLSQNGNLNMIGIFERVASPKFPATFSRLSLVTSLKTDSGEHKNTLRIVNEKNEEIMKQIDINLNVNDGNSDIRLIGDINNLQIQTPGKYKIEIHFDDKKIHELAFQVEQAQKPVPQNR
jgi:hypothetical protein